MQLTDEPDKRCYPLDDHLLCHGCHIKRLRTEYPDEQFYIDPYTYNILNKIPKGSQRDSIAIMPASLSAFPPNHSIQMSGNSDAPPPLPPPNPYRKINQNGVDCGFNDQYDSSRYSNKPAPQVPPGKPNNMKYTITDLWLSHSMLGKISADNIVKKWFFVLLFRENKSWQFMWIICLADDSHEMSRLVFSEK